MAVCADAFYGLLGALGVAQDSRARAFGTTFFLTLSNPMTIFSFIGIFAALGSSLGTGQGGGPAGWVSVAPMVAGVLAGSAAWWLLLSGASAMLRKKMPARLASGVALLSALAIAAFGVTQFVSGLMHVLRSA
ncbi:MAG TPA: hypothetical protein VGC69_07390 [Bordetella sp.]